MAKKYTKEQLIAAMRKYNEEVIQNPEEFGSIDNDSAEVQVEHLLSLVD